MGYGHNFKDLTGQKFGMLTVLGINFNKIKRTHWECICGCGIMCTKEGSKLVSGHTASCGCLKKKGGFRFIDLTGQKFNMLTVISEYSRIKGKVRWNCICDCGKKHIAMASNLKNGAVKSCGCLGKDNLLKRTTHGFSKTQLGHTFDNMKARCYRKSTKCYHNYGGRGIRICKEWLENPNNFYQWALSNGFKEGLTIERIDCNKDYCPENCTWIPQVEQSRNRRVSLGVEKVREIKLLLKSGKSAVDISKTYNVHPTTIGYIKRGKAYPYVIV